jgi:hypothetical protein
MRLAIIAIIMFAGLTAGNIVVYQRDTAGLRNPYAAPATPPEAVVASAAAQDVSQNALRNAWLREAGAVVLVGVLWVTISRSGATSGDSR